MKLKRSKGTQQDSPNRRQGVSKVDARPDATDLSNRYAFRRNRTLTGSSSSTITSSNELNAELKSPRAHVHHLTNLRRRLLLYFVGVGLAALGLYVLVSQLVASVDVSIAGSAPLSKDSQAPYSKSLEAYYAARPVERFRFLLNEDALLAHIQATLPEVQAVAVEPGSKLGEASIAMVARKPIARWSIDGANKYVDGRGVVFATNYYEDPTLQIIDSSGLQTSTNQLVASNRFLGFIGRVVSKSESSGLSVAKVTIPQLTTRQVSISLEGQGTEYRLSVDRSAGEQVEDISRIARYMTSNKLNPGYVDVRISGKAFYK